MEAALVDTLAIESPEDVVIARQEVRKWATRLGFSMVNQTKLITAASELARNAVIYGGGGTMTLSEIRNGAKVALKLVFEDQGPGIADLKLAMTDGYTSGGGLGLGLSGSKRLVNEFDIWSEAGRGTRITITQWK